MAQKGGVDSKPIGGFKDAMAKYQQKAGGSGDDTSKPAPSGGGKNALFASINAGGAAGSLTKGLNKVTSDMKTKNRKDRSGKVPNATNKKASASVKKQSEKKEQDKPAEIKLMGSIIRASYYKKMDKLLIFGSSADDPNEKKDDPYTPEDMKIYDPNAVSIKNEIEIWDCDTAMFRISKKCKSVKLYNCKNVQISVKAVISTIELTNSNKITLFVKEKAGSMVLEKCDGAKVWIDEQVAQSDPPPQLYTTLCQNTEFNVSQGEDKDPLAVPVPSQFVTSLVDGKWKTTSVDHV